MTLRLLSFYVVCAVVAAACAPQGRAADYATKVSFKKDSPIQFADFVLTYLGERHVKSDRFPRGFTYQDFRVTAGSEVQTVSWSAGTGDIGPAIFRVGSKQFGLELSRSDKLGPLKSSEVVVSRSP